MQTGQKTAFVFAGGGSLGAVQVGMLRSLLAAGFRYWHIGRRDQCRLFRRSARRRGVAKLAGIWSGLRRSDVFPFTFANAFGLLRHPDYIVDPGRLRRLLEKNLPYARLEDAAIPVHVAATNVQGMAVVLSKGPAIDAILASAAIPGIFPPVRIDGEALMDGAIANNTPILAAAKLGASRIVVLPTGYACALK